MTSGRLTKSIDVIVTGRPIQGWRCPTPRPARAREAESAMPCVDAEPFVEFRLPLVGERCGCDDEHAPVARSFQDLGDDEAGLNRLAEADFVSDQDGASGHPVRDGQRRLELEWRAGRFALAVACAATARTE